MKELYDLIKQFEGCKLKAYKCPAGVWTCGWGSTGPDVVEGTVWTQQQANARMEKDVKVFVDGVLKVSPVLKDYPNKLSAIADFAYNCGLGNYRSSTLCKKVNAGDWEGAAEEFGKWTKAGGKELAGLVRRRQAEKQLFLCRM